MNGDSDKSEPNSSNCGDSYKDEMNRLRQKLRDLKEEHRENQRQYILKKIRHLKDEKDEHLPQNISKSQFKKLVNALKKKKILGKVLKGIMNALLDHEDYVNIFFSVDGSLQVLLREFSGQNEKFQLLSAGCICNLALGSKKLSWKLLKATQPYLYVHLSGMNCYVKEACVIALGNFSRHGPKPINFLLRQNFFPQIINLLNGNNECVQSAALYALSQIVFYGFDILSLEHFESVFKACVSIYTKRIFPVAFLMSLLSACEECHVHFYVHQLHIESLNNLAYALKDEDKDAVFYLRIVSNCVAESLGRMAEDLIEKFGELVRHCVKLLLKSKHTYLQKECGTLIANFLNHPRHYESFGTSLVCDNIREIYKFLDSSAVEDMGSDSP